MGKNLLDDFDSILNKESKRIFKLLINKYEKHEKVNKEFCEIILDLIKLEYMFYKTDIQIRILKLLSDSLVPDPEGQSVLITREQAIIMHLKNYSKHMKKFDPLKDPEKVSLKLANILIRRFENKTLDNKDLIVFVAENMDNIYSGGYDSVDARAIMLYFEEALNKKGYEIINSNPLSNKKTKKSLTLLKKKSKVDFNINF